METVEGNKLIADFIGFDINSSTWDEEDLQYHASWDWLMPVWRKCIDVIGLWAHTHKDDNKSKVWLNASDNIRVALTSVDITKAVQEIAALIQWYNTQKQNQ